MDSQSAVEYQYITIPVILNSTSVIDWTVKNIYTTSAPSQVSGSDLIRFREISKRLAEFNSEEIEADIETAFQEYRASS